MFKNAAAGRPKNNISYVRKLFQVLFLVWTAVIATFFIWDMRENRMAVFMEARGDALANFNKDIAIRAWATSHGGVYVPVDENTQPNPYLSNIEERDVVTPSGRILTLMNPAYISRQINEIFAKNGSVFGHITSLKLKNPANKPDKWEENALKAFERGEKERFEVTDINGEPFLRLMRPVIADKGCLKCHGNQGYKVGDIRGGITVSTALGSYYAHARTLTRNHAVLFAFIWILGSAGMFVGGRYAEKTEASSRQISERLKVVLTPINMAVFNQDLDLRYTWMFQPQLGYSPADVVGKLDFDLLPADLARQVTDLKRKVLETGLGARGEVCGTLNDDKIYYDLVVEPLRDGAGQIIGITGASLDITERKHMETVLLDAKNAAEGSNLLKAEILSNMTHELNTPLTSILGFSRLANQRYKAMEENLVKISDIIDLPDDIRAARLVEARILIQSAIEGIGESKEFDEVVYNQGQNLLGLLNDLIDFSRLESGHLKFDTHVVSASMLLTTIKITHELAAKTKGLAFSTNAADFSREDLLFAGDVRWLEKALNILVENAIKFSNSGEVAVTTVREGAKILFRVKDEGIGIPAQEQQSIFDTFRQLDGSHSRQYGGLGLGLAFARNLVRMMDGELSLKSTVGKGSEFILTIPYRQVANGEPTVQGI